MFQMAIVLWNDYSLPLFSQTLVYNMEDNEQSGAAAQSEETSNNNMELNDQPDTDGESGYCEIIKSCAQCICGMTLKIAVKIAIIFRLVALGSVITGVTVSTQHKSHSHSGRHEYIIYLSLFIPRVSEGKGAEDASEDDSVLHMSQPGGQF